MPVTMFHTLSNVQSGKPVCLQQYIDNQTGALRVALRSITYTVGWYNLEDGEYIAWEIEGRSQMHDLDPGLYHFMHIQGIFKGLFRGRDRHPALGITRIDGMVKLYIPEGWRLLITDGLLKLLGLDDGLGKRWLDPETYTGDRPVDFATVKTLHIHLNQISTPQNCCDGAPSTLLAVVPVAGSSITRLSHFGDVHHMWFSHLEFKQLQEGRISEFEASIRDENGKILNNHGLPISLTLEILAI